MTSTNPSQGPTQGTPNTTETSPSRYRRTIPLSYDFPRIVCLCGSTRFWSTFEAVNLEETLAGRIVLSVGCVTSSDSDLGITENQKADLDDLHMRKIELADEVYIINVVGYIGQSTMRELRYAISLGKRIRFHEPVTDLDLARVDVGAAVIDKFGNLVRGHTLYGDYRGPF